MDFKAARRDALRTELVFLQKEGLIALGSDHKWRAINRVGNVSPSIAGKLSSGEVHGQSDLLTAAPAKFSTETIPRRSADNDSEHESSLDARKLIRYYRAALQSDPRGALTQADDRHGTSYQLITGNGDPVPGEGQAGIIQVELANLPDSFRVVCLLKHGTSWSVQTDSRKRM